MCGCEKPEIARDILSYLTEYPDAQDTLAGITEWWLLDQRITVKSAQVKEVIEKLVEKRLLLERKGRDSQTHYRINRRKGATILALLKENPDQRSRRVPSKLRQFVD